MVDKILAVTPTGRRKALTAEQAASIIGVSGFYAGSQRHQASGLVPALPSNFIAHTIPVPPGVNKLIHISGSYVAPRVAGSSSLQVAHFAASAKRNAAGVLNIGIDGNLKIYGETAAIASSLAFFPYVSPSGDDLLVAYAYDPISPGQGAGAVVSVVSWAILDSPIPVPF